MPAPTSSRASRCFLGTSATPHTASTSKSKMSAPMRKCSRWHPLATAGCARAATRSFASRCTSTCPDISPVAQLERVLERGERGSIDRSILFVGDSLTLQLYEAARCTLPSKYHDALEYADVEALVDFRKTLARKKRGVVLLNLGLRFGPGEREQLRGRADELVGELERWSSDCGDASPSWRRRRPSTFRRRATASGAVTTRARPSALHTSRWAAAARRCGSVCANAAGAALKPQRVAERGGERGRPRGGQPRRPRAAPPHLPALVERDARRDEQRLPRAEDADVCGELPTTASPPISCSRCGGRSASPRRATP